MITFAANAVFADIGQIVIGIIALVFLVIRQLLEANKAAGVQRIRPPVPPAGQLQQPAKGAAPAAGQQADPLRAQVEEFLRRAGRSPEQGPQRSSQRPADQSPAKRNEIENERAEVAADRTFGQPLRQAEWRATPAATSPPAVTIKVADKPRSQRGSTKSRRRQSVADHVAEQVTAHTQSLAQNASRLGQRIVAEDQQFDVQLKAKFDHTVGTLAESAMPSAAEQTPPPSNSPAVQIASLLANPGSLQQAVLLNEILQRPSDRW